MGARMRRIPREDAGALPARELEKGEQRASERVLRSDGTQTQIRDRAAKWASWSGRAERRNRAEDLRVTKPKYSKFSRGYGVKPRCSMASG